jgi:homoserine dehydrogenase
LVASIDRVLAIVNGTSNYVLTALGDPGTTFDHALSRAQALGYAEPDASRDLDGIDAADTLLLLTTLFGWGRVSREALDVDGIRHVTAADLIAARSIGGTIKPVVSAERDASGVRAFVGPAFLPATEPLSSLGGTLNGVRLDGRHVSNLFFSGPGAGPAVTAATLLDDAIQAASFERPIDERPQPSRPPVVPSSPPSAWFMRVTFPGVVPPPAAVAQLVTAAGLPVEGVVDHTSQDSRWLLVGRRCRRDVTAAIATLSSTHRIAAAAFRRL